MQSRDSTPIVKDDNQNFQQLQLRDYPISRIVVIQNKPPAAPSPPSVVRLLPPYLTFSTFWPISKAPQGARAFIRSSMVFQPATHQYRSLFVATSSPPASNGHVSDAPTTPPNTTPQLPNQQWCLCHKYSIPSHIDCLTTEETAHTDSFIDSEGITLNATVTAATNLRYNRRFILWSESPIIILLSISNISIFAAPLAPLTRGIDICTHWRGG